MALLSALMLLCICNGTGLGHTFPARSEPRVGATVLSPPPRVCLWFDGALEPTFSTLRVRNEKGQLVDNGDGHVNSSNPKMIEVSLPNLPPGTYSVLWSVVARDGHRTDGDYKFTIK